MDEENRASGTPNYPRSKFADEYANPWVRVMAAKLLQRNNYPAMEYANHALTPVENGDLSVPLAVDELWRLHYHPKLVVTTGITPLAVQVHAALIRLISGEDDEVCVVPAPLGFHSVSPEEAQVLGRGAVVAVVGEFRYEQSLCEWAVDMKERLGVGNTELPYALPDPIWALSHPDEVNLDLRGDHLYTVLCSVNRFVEDNPTGPGWKAAWKLMGRAGRDHDTSAACKAGTILNNLARSRRADMPLMSREVSAFVPMLKVSGLLQV